MRSPGLRVEIGKGRRKKYRLIELKEIGGREEGKREAAGCNFRSIDRDWHGLFHANAIIVSREISRRNETIQNCLASSLDFIETSIWIIYIFWSIFVSSSTHLFVKNFHPRIFIESISFWYFLDKLTFTHDFSLIPYYFQATKHLEETRYARVNARRGIKG